MNTSRYIKAESAIRATSQAQESQELSAAFIVNGQIAPALFQDILESFPYQLAILDKEHHFIFFNKAFQEPIQRLLGKQLRPGDTIERTYEGAPAILQRALILYQNALEGHPYTFTDTLPSQPEQANETTCNPLRNSEGECIGAIVVMKTHEEWRQAQITGQGIQAMLGQLVDAQTRELQESNRILQKEIEDRKRAEEALRQREQHFRLLAEMIPQAVCMFNNQARPIFSNKQARERFGILQDDTDRSRNWEKFFHPEDWPSITQLIGQMRNEGLGLNVEVRMWCIDEEAYRWQQLTIGPVLDGEGRVSEWIISMTDIDNLKKAEEESRQNEEKLRWLTDAMPHLVWEMRADGIKIEYVNQRWLEYRGIEHIPGVELSSEGFAHPDDIEEVQERWQQAIRRKESYEGEFRIRRAADDTYRWHLVRCQPIKNSKGQVNHWLGTATDIHDNKEIQEKLQQSEQNFRILADAMPQIVWTARPDGWLDYYNQKWFDYTGMNLEQTQGWGWEPVLHPDDVQKCINTWTHSFQTGEPYQIEYRFKRVSDGMYRWHLGRALPIRDEQGQIIKWFGTGTDIHDWKMAEEMIRINEQNFRLLADLMPQMVMVFLSVGQDEQVEYCNRLWQEYTGLNIENSSNGGRYRVVHPEDKARLNAAWQQGRSQHKDFEIEMRIRRRDGVYHWHLTRARPIPNENGEAVKWLGTSVDIHENKMIQERLSEAVQQEQMLRAEAEATNERLEQMNKVQSDFISIVSHEFRTTLTGIQGFSELLCGEDFTADEVRDYAKDIHHDARRLTRMINDLLDLERMKSGKMTLQMEEIDSNAILQGVVERARASTTQHSLRFIVDRRLPHFWGDSDKLIQVMTNLVSNAIKYSPNGGEIVITSKKEKNAVHIKVQDQGMGIPENALDDVFAPYSRIDAQRTRYIKGTGLGLAIVRQIVEMHGGQVWVESELGKGSTFHVVLPLKRPEAS